MGIHALDCDGHLKSAKKNRHDPSYEQDWPEKASKVIVVLIFHPLELRISEQKWGVEIKSSEPDLTVYIAFGNIAIKIVARSAVK